MAESQSYDGKLVSEVPAEHRRSWAKIGDEIEIAGKSWEGYTAKVVEMNGQWLSIECQLPRGGVYSGRVKVSNVKSIVRYGTHSVELMESMTGIRKPSFSEKFGDDESETWAEALEWEVAKPERQQHDPDVTPTRAADWKVNETTGKVEYVGERGRTVKNTMAEIDDDDWADSKHWENAGPSYTKSIKPTVTRQSLS